MNYSWKELSEIYGRLNNWSWDERAGPTPEGWRWLDREKKSEYIRPVNESIEARVPEIVLKYYRVKRIHGYGAIEALLSVIMPFKIRYWLKNNVINELRLRGFMMMSKKDRNTYKLLRERGIKISKKRYMEVVLWECDR